MNRRIKVLPFDEIAELPIDLQPKLLRVLETGEVRRVGGSQTFFVDVRIISATHRDLHKEVERNRFREDLLYRLHVIPIDLPALRERKKDIAHLVHHFLQTDAQKYQQPPKKITPEAIDLLMKYSWPGNIRELKNIVQRAIILSHHDPEIGPTHIQFYTSPTENNTDHGDASLASIEKKAIQQALINNQWNKTKTAQILGIAKSTLHLKIQQYEITQP
ncbi:MAG: sigma 54-interacting transcriptional regulator [Bdellovibrionota bacterium]